MSNYNPAAGGLQYRGTNASSPPNLWSNHSNPTPFDTQGFSLGDLWINTNNSMVFILVSLAGSSKARRSIAVWAPFTGTSLGSQTLNGVAYGNGTGNPIQWTAQGGTNTVLAANNGAPFFTSNPTVTEMTITGTVTNPTDAATKAYVDEIASGFTFIGAVRVATTANLNATYSNGAAGVGATLTNAGAQSAITIDGVALNLTDRVLVKNQASQANNGIYTVTTVGTGATNWVLTRSTDYDLAPGQIKPGNIVPVTAGSTNANTLWLQTATVATIGTDPIIFVPFGIEPVTPLPIAQGGTNATSFTNTDGVVYYDGTRLNTTTVGTSGQVLISNGAGMAPSFQTKVFDSAYVLLQTQVISAPTSQVAFTSLVSSSYNNYVFFLNNVITDQGAFSGIKVLMQVSIDNGATWIAPGSYASLLSVDLIAATPNIQSTSDGIYVGFSVIYPGTTSIALGGQLWCYSITDGNNATFITSTTYDNSALTFVNSYGRSSLFSVTGINAFRFIMQGGATTNNINSGVFSLYGLLM